MIKRPLHYLDNNATTRVAPEVVDALLPCLTECWGNPSSGYRFGHDLAGLIARAREQSAALIGASPDSLVFTSGGTESTHTAMNAALLGRPDRRHMIVSAVEHPAMFRLAQEYNRRGYKVTALLVGSNGQFSLDTLRHALTPDTAVVSVMWANNETGVLFPIREVAQLCRERGVLIHTDAVQAAGKVPIDVKDSGVDFLSLSGHKFHAPKGVGLLYVRPGVAFHPFLFGGKQEQGRRGGTENVPGIVGFGAAAERALNRLPEMESRVRVLRDRLESTLLARVPGAQRNGPADPRLPNTSNLAFEGIEAEGLMLELDQLGICVSTGSACSSGSPRPSHVLTAMGCNPRRARASVRFSLGLDSSDDDVEAVLAHVPGIVARLRAEAPGA
jgi:cysteine desulfurase